MVDVSVIVVNYNTTNLVCDALESLYHCTREIEYEVIVVDNASHDSLQVIRDKFPNVKVMILNENIGFGRANNEGIKIAKGRNIFLLNPDTVVLNNAVKILSDYLDEHPLVGVCGGNLFSKDMQPATSYEKRLPSLKTLCLESLHLYTPNKNYFNYGDSPIKVGYITGADMMIRHDILKHVGLFDSDFFMYAEEVELTYRIKKAGFNSVSVPQAKIIHLEGKSFEFSEKRVRMQFQGRKLYFQKRYGFLGAWCFTFVRRILIYQYIIIFSIRNRQDLVKQWKNILPLITWH